MSRASTALACALLLAACGREERPWTSPLRFDTAEVRVGAGADATRLVVEVARTDDQRRLGLSIRPALDPASGMVFLFDSVQADTAGFWMWRTKMPLDIAFIDSAGRIATIVEMEPCESPNPEWCPAYRPGARYSAALEVSRGWFARHGIGVGDPVALDAAGAPGG